MPVRPSARFEGGDQIAVLDASPNAIVAIDPSGRIAYANAQVETTFGHPPAAVLGQPIELLLPERSAAAHVARRERYLRRPVARPMGIGIDLAGRRRDGTEFPVEISLSPVRTPDGLRVYATVVDITARKRAEAALAESEARFRAVLEASPNAIVAVDAEGRISYLNPQVEATFGYGRDDLIGRPIEVLLPERIGERHVGHRDGFLGHPVARPMGINLDLAGRRRDGSEFPVEISLSPVETSDGLQVFATVVDITARKAAEQQLLQAQKLESIGRLAGGIAHDFNNMLFAIRGHSELLGEDLASVAPQHLPTGVGRSLEAIVAAAERATALTSQLLAFSRKQVVSPMIVDPNQAIQGILPMLRPLLGETVQIRIHLDPAVGNIRIDPGQFDQILVNLAVNARDAMPDGGAITLETAVARVEDGDRAALPDLRTGPHVVVAVSDTGQGMDRETREHAFEPFFTTKELGRGTGLGLATIHGIVHQAGGHVWLYSEPHHGTTFKLYFPEVTETATAVPSASATIPTGTGRVLVAEDDPDVRSMIVLVLERAGFEVTSVTDGRSALGRLEADPHSVDVIVSDVIMPGMSGLALAEQILQRRPRIGIVLLSGYTAETLDLARVVAGGAIFVSKPVTSRVLVESVQLALGRANRLPGGARTTRGE